MAKLAFTAGSQRLVISVGSDEIKWSSLFVERDDGLVPLGSESLPVIMEKLVPALRSVGRAPTKLYRGVGIVPLINLSEPHAALSAEPLGDGGVALHLLDANNEFVRVMRLSGQDFGRLVGWLDGLA